MLYLRSLLFLLKVSDFLFCAGPTFQCALVEEKEARSAVLCFHRVVLLGN